MVSNIGNLGVNYATGLLNDYRQVRMNETTGRQNLRLSNWQTDYNMQKQLELWQKTGPVGMTEQLNKAGLNPALQYGMSGAGGGTTAVQTGHQQGNSNIAPMNNPMDIAQIMLLEAQRKKIEAETNNLNMGTTKLDQEQYEIGLRNAIERFMQGYNEYDEPTDNYGDTIRGKMILQDLIAKEIGNQLTAKGVQVGQADIEKMTKDIIQRGEEIKIQQGHLDVAKQLANFNTDWSNILGKEAVQAIGGIIQLFGLKKVIGGAGHKAIEGFRRKY